MKLKQNVHVGERETYLKITLSKNLVKPLGRISICEHVHILYADFVFLLTLRCQQLLTTLNDFINFRLPKITKAYFECNDSQTIPPSPPPIQNERFSAFLSQVFSLKNTVSTTF